jgi:uncharacterized protein YdeI (YjbR/CyaY-like superfamily)
MDKEKKPYLEFYAKDRKAWRKWLQVNHLKLQQVWLILHKKSSQDSSVNYEEAVEEALCFGWIDSKPMKRDDHTFLLFFSQRKPKSVWSASNKKRLVKLIADGQMMPAGLVSIEIAKANGSWTSIDDVEAMVMPVQLEKAFKKNKLASANFNAFPASAKKGIYQWISSAKTDTTREKRIFETVSLAQKNIRANQWKGPKKKNERI